MSRSIKYRLAAALVLLAVAAVPDAARAQTSGDKAEASVAEVLCDGADSQPEMKTCRRVCTARPPGIECVVYLRHGARGLDAANAIVDSPGQTDEAFASRFGVAESDIHLLRLLLDDRGYVGVVARTQPETRKIEAGGQHHAKGAEAKKRSDWDAAVQHYRAALNTWREVYGDQHPAVGFAHNELGVALGGRGEREEALRHYREAVAILQKVYGASSPELAILQMNVARALEARGSYLESLAYLEKATRLRARLLGESHSATASSREAAARMQSLIRKARRAVSLRVELGTKHLQSSNSEEALEQFEAALETADGIYAEPHPDVAEAWQGSGRVHARRGEYTVASQHMREALALRRVLYGPEHPEVAESLMHLAEVYEGLENRSKSLEILRRVLSIQRKTLPTGHADVIATLRAIARAHELNGDYQRALPFHRQALGLIALNRELSHPQIAAGLNELGDNLRKSGEIQEAIRYYKRALAIQRKALDRMHSDVGQTWDRIGAAAASGGDFDRALDAYMRALRIEEHHSDGEDDISPALLLGIAESYSKSGQRKRAAEYYRRALQATAKLLPILHPVRLDLLELAAAEFAAAGEVEEALATLDRAFTASWTYLIIHAQATGSDIGMRRLRASLQGSFDLTLSLIAGPDKSFSKFVAWQGLATRIERVSRLRQQRLASADSQTSDLIVRNEKLERRFLKKALACVISKKAIAQCQQELQTLEADYRSHTNELKKRDASYVSAMRQVPVDMRRFFSVLRRQKRVLVSFGRYQRYDSNSDSRVPSYVAFVVDPGGKDKKPRIVRHDLPAEKVDQAVQAYRDQIARAEEFYGKADKKSEFAAAAAAMDAAGKELRRLVWDPVANEFGSSTDVLVVPDGRLLEISFGALPRDDGSYLVEHLKLAYLPYPGAVIDRASGSAKAKGAFVAGDLDYATTFKTASAARSKWNRCTNDCQTIEADQAKMLASRDVDATRGTSVCGYNETWGPLPATEAAAVAKQLGAATGQASVLVTGAAAHEQAVRAALPGKRVIHLATHGFYSPAEQCRQMVDGGDARGAKLLQNAEASEPLDPLKLSALVLSGANKSKKHERGPEADGVLSARDIIGLDLRGTELVTLAACETGRGSQTAGEGSLGLARAFLVAGAKATVVARWQVPGRTTVSLFDDFYQSALEDADSDKEALGAAAALRKAQLNQLKQHRAAGLEHSAFLWGAFVPIQNGL